MKTEKEVLYVGFDVEAAGPLLGTNCTLSVGASPVLREALGYEQRVRHELVFYAELKPQSLEFSLEAMRVGCAHLECIEEKRKDDSRFDPQSEHFVPRLVLEHMAQACEEPEAAALRFQKWLDKLRGTRPVVPLVDTVFFDSGRVNLWLNAAGIKLNHGGRDLKSLYQGLTGRCNARLTEIAVDRNAKPHRADHDAVELAQKAKIVLYDRLNW